MGASTERADDMAKARHGVERGIENRSTHGVVDQIEAAACGVLGDIIGDRAPRSFGCDVCGYARLN